MGVKEGYEKRLEIVGVGYGGTVQGNGIVGGDGSGPSHSQDVTSVGGSLEFPDLGAPNSDDRTGWPDAERGWDRRANDTGTNDSLSQVELSPGGVTLLVGFGDGDLGVSSQDNRGDGVLAIGGRCVLVIDR